MSNFVFVPRTVSKAKKLANSLEPSTNAASLARNTEYVNTNSTKSIKGKAKDVSVLEAPRDVTKKLKFSDEDYANLLCLALSDYAMWLDPELRRNVEWNSRPEPGHQGNDGFIPLTTLLQTSKILGPLSLLGLETPIVKAVRSLAATSLEVRLSVSMPSVSAWFNSSDSTDGGGGYEIRRKDWGSIREHLSRAQWEERSVYLENIPVQFRTIPGIVKFTLALLSGNPAPETQPNRVQGISLPPHHQDKPGDLPVSKGFAIVVLSRTEDAEYLIKEWPWNWASVDEVKTSVVPSSTETQEATKLGFRTLSKVSWGQLREEYIAYRGRLIKEINASEDVNPLIVVSSVSQSVPQEEQYTLPAKDPPIESDTPILDLSSPYPPNSLVFVRNVHPETNKTTLRKFFAASLQESVNNGIIKSDGLDYIDFNKGTDSCHIRLTTPKHAGILTKYFSSNNLCQTHGLADSGTLTDVQKDTISAELVVDRREELYWEKVPEKVRREAVRRAVSLLQPAGGAVDEEDGADTQPRKQEERRKRKKRN